MNKKNLIISILTVFLMTALLVSAQEEEMGGMPPMGPPEEMKELAWLTGEWDVAMSWRMTPDGEWMASKGVATYSMVLEGSTLQMEYSGSDMPMPFVGLMLQTYDRVAGHFQSVWVDNMSARMSYYTGNKEGEKMVLSGEEIMPDGSTALARVTTFNHTETSFDWTMEMSGDGGKTWWTSGKATYTKK